MPKKTKLMFHSDPGHGWLEVPLETFLLAQAKLSAVSAYSYCGLSGFGMNLYLEEDCDAAVFLSAAKAAGMQVEVVHKNHDHDCFVRQLSSIPFEEIKPIVEKHGVEF